MATAMHEDEATASNDIVCNPTLKSVAEREFRRKLKAQDDLESHVLAKVVLNEHLELLARKEPNGILAFMRTISAMADWAIEQLGDIQHFDVPHECKDTRMFLCRLIIGGWLNGSDWDVQKRCARALLYWPTTEAEEVSKLLRKHLESTAGMVNSHQISRILGEFFVGAEMSTGNNEIWRTVFKAIGRHVDMQDLVILGQALYVLQSKETVPLRNVVRHGLSS